MGFELCLFFFVSKWMLIITLFFYYSRPVACLECEQSPVSCDMDACSLSLTSDLWFVPLEHIKDYFFSHSV